MTASPQMAVTLAEITARTNTQMYSAASSLLLLCLVRTNMFRTRYPSTVVSSRFMTKSQSAPRHFLEPNLALRLPGGVEVLESHTQALCHGLLALVNPNARVVEPAKDASV